MELVDIVDKYAVKGRRGLHQWGVWAVSDKVHQANEAEGEQKDDEKKVGKKYLKLYNNIDEAKNFHKIKSTMFAPSLEVAKERHLEYTMRVLPHDQNSGGFYVALFKKNMDFEWKYSATQKKKMEEKGEEEIEEEFLEKNLP